MKIQIKPNDQSLVDKELCLRVWVSMPALSGITKFVPKFVGEQVMIGETFYKNKPKSIGDHWGLGHDWELYEEPKKECEHFWTKAPIDMFYGCKKCGVAGVGSPEGVLALKPYKKKPKLLSPALYQDVGGEWVLSKELYLEKPKELISQLYHLYHSPKEPVYLDIDKINLIWPALDANGKPIQYLIEEDN